MRAAGPAGYRTGVAHTYPPLNVEIRTPRLTLAGASDELLERLVPLVRAGIADAEPWPFDDPISFYADSPEREWRWLRGIWTGRGRVSPDSWRLYFAVLVDGEPVGMQDLGHELHPVRDRDQLLVAGARRRGQGLGREMRAAILQLAFAGPARAAGSDAFVDRHPTASGAGTSQHPGAHPGRVNGSAGRHRADGVEECLPVLGIG